MNLRSQKTPQQLVMGISIHLWIYLTMKKISVILQVNFQVLRNIEILRTQSSAKVNRNQTLPLFLTRHRLPKWETILKLNSHNNRSCNQSSVKLLHSKAWRYPQSLQLVPLVEIGLKDRVSNHRELTNRKSKARQAPSMGSFLQVQNHTKVSTIFTKTYHRQVIVVLGRTLTNLSSCFLVIRTRSKVWKSQVSLHRNNYL